MNLIKYIIPLILLILIGVSCSQSKSIKISEATLAKIKFPIDQIDDNGLYGSADGKRSLDYEFCIPKDETSIAIIKKINPNIQMPEGSRGRINCKKTQQLCLGNTHHKDWKNQLLEIANQDFVVEIRQNFFE